MFFGATVLASLASSVRLAGAALLGGIALVDPVVPEVLVLLSCLLFFSATGVNRVIAAPYLLFMRMLRRMGTVRDRRTWGVVYDSVTKDPVDPAYVTVHGRLGTIAATAITDLDGRFGIIVPQGIYTLSVEKTNYSFPSARLVGNTTDGYYTGLYFGGQFEVTESERALAFAVPIDPIESDWNQAEKRRKHLHARDRKAFRSAAAAYFLIAGALIIVRYGVFPGAETLRTFQLYAGILVVGLLYSFLMPTRYYHSVILDKDTNKPLGFARIKVFNKATGIQAATKKSSLNGQFVCLVPNGVYYVVIERRTADGTYVPTHTSEPFRVPNRAINRRFLV